MESITLEQERTQNATAKIQWPQVVALLLLDFAVIISWIAYHEFQPKVLEQFGLVEFLVQFTILQGVILVVTPPIAGFIADRLKAKSGNSMGLVNVGVSTVSLVFMSVALTIFINPTGPVKFVLPLLIVLWLISMNLFRSPAISLIEQFVPQNQLPKVIALFVVVFDIAYALEPSIVGLLNWIGGPGTFAVGGVLVFSTGLYLRKSFSKAAPVQGLSEFDTDTQDGKSDFITVMLISLGLGFVTTLIFKYLPVIYSVKTPEIVSFFTAPEYFVSVMIAFSALGTFIFGRIVKQSNVVMFNLVGFGLTFSAILAMIGLSSPAIIYLMTVVVAVGFSMLSVTSLPIVLYRLSTKQTIFGIGLFYGGNELADAVWALLSI